MTYNECAEIKAKLDTTIMAYDLIEYDLLIVPETLSNFEKYIAKVNFNWIDENSIPFALDGQFKLMWIGFFMNNTLFREYIHIDS